MMTSRDHLSCFVLACLILRLQPDPVVNKVKVSLVEWKICTFQKARQADKRTFPLSEESNGKPPPSSFYSVKPLQVQPSLSVDDLNNGSWGFHVELRAPRYVSLGNSALLKCDYSVPHELLHKVEWLRHGKKIFQYVKGRRPPFRNYTIPGAFIDWSGSNERQLFLRSLDFEASSVYSCEVTTETPIYTKPSDEREITVVQSQLEDPRISFRKPVYTVGDWLEVNCTSAPATPTPHVTWLLNGKQVDDSNVKSFRQQMTSTVTAQLRFQIQEDHREQLELTCLATIPNFLGHSASHTEYADHRAQSVAVEVISTQDNVIPASRSKSLKILSDPYLVFLILSISISWTSLLIENNFLILIQR